MKRIVAAFTVIVLTLAVAACSPIPAVGPPSGLSRITFVFNGYDVVNDTNISIPVDAVIEIGEYDGSLTIVDGLSGADRIFPLAVPAQATPHRTGIYVEPGAYITFHATAHTRARVGQRVECWVEGVDGVEMEGTAQTTGTVNHANGPDGLGDAVASCGYEQGVIPQSGVIVVPPIPKPEYP